MAPNREHGARAAAEPHGLCFQAAGLAAQEVSLEATCPAAMPCLEHSLVRGEVGLVHLRLQSLPRFPRPWRRVQMLLPGWAELRRGRRTEPGTLGACWLLISAGPRLRRMRIFTVLLLEVTERQCKGETWVNSYACLLTIYIGRV